MKSKSGEIYNDLPDRISDCLIFVPAGYAVPGISELAWAAGLLAVFNAYVRILGGSTGTQQYGCGEAQRVTRYFFTPSYPDWPLLRWLSTVL
jgi:hypothetical protein